MSRSTARDLLRAPALLVALALAGCGGSGGRPDPLPDQAQIVLSATHIAFAMDAYVPGSLFPAAAAVDVTNPSSAPLSGPPTVFKVEYGSESGWLTSAIAPAGAGYRLDLGLANVDFLNPGSYQALVLIAWAGAANSPQQVLVDLVVHPYPRTWPTGSPTLSNVRMNHTTTALLDGGAVSIGGMYAENTIERLDPATWSWSWSSSAADHASLRNGRSSHTATLLADGRVLVAGGQSQDGWKPGGTWEIWDPDAGDNGAVTAGGALARDRYDHAAIRLLDGRVLIAGGWRTEAGVLGGTRSCELFDPVTQRSLETAGLHGDASEVTPIALLLDGTGRVLVTNQTPTGKEVGAELFDPATNTWTVVEPRPQPRIEHAMVALRDGRVVVFGGFDPETTTPLQSTEIFDPRTGHWTPGGPLFVPHLFIPSDAVLLPKSGKVLVAGGMRTVPPPASETFEFTALVEIFDPATGSWSVQGALGDGVMWHTVTVLKDGTVYALGGIDLYAPGHKPAYFWREP